MSSVIESIQTLLVDLPTIRPHKPGAGKTLYRSD